MPHQPGTRWPQLFALMVVVLAGLATSPLPTEAQATPKLVISFLDVGQGDATLLITPSGGSVLVNCGLPAQSNQLILRLESAGISQIDTLVLTSVRTDAAGGCADVLNYLSVGQVIWS